MLDLAMAHVAVIASEGAGCFLFSYLLFVFVFVFLFQLEGQHGFFSLSWLALNLPE